MRRHHSQLTNFGEQTISYSYWQQKHEPFFLQPLTQSLN